MLSQSAQLFTSKTSWNFLLIFSDFFNLSESATLSPIEFEISFAVLVVVLGNVAVVSSARSAVEGLWETIMAIFLCCADVRWSVAVSRPMCVTAASRAVRLLEAFEMGIWGGRVSNTNHAKEPNWEIYPMYLLTSLFSLTTLGTVGKSIFLKEI